FFFFSSRRRHTRCYRDWSSDVCSSDLSTLSLQLDIQLLPPASRYAPPGVVVFELPVLQVVLAKLPGKVGGFAVDDRREADPAIGRVKQADAEGLELRHRLHEVLFLKGDLFGEAVTARAPRPG